MFFLHSTSQLYELLTRYSWFGEKVLMSSRAKNIFRCGLLLAVPVVLVSLFATSSPAIPEQAHDSGESTPPQIVDPQGTMEHFYRQLDAVAAKRTKAVARIAVYGTSINGADRVTSRIRHRLQKRFGDAGRGWVGIAPGWSSHHYQDVEWTTHTFRTNVVNRGKLDHGRYGLGGVIAFNRGIGSKASFGTVSKGPSNRSASRFRLFYQAYPEGGDVLLQVEGGAEKRVSTRATKIEDRVAELRVPPGPHTFWVRVGEGALRLYGAVMENDGPGVVVDGLSMIGASVLMMDNFDGAHLSKQVALRSPDLLVFWLGGNDVPAKRFRREYFVERYGRMIARARRGRPEASCLVLSVLDKGHYHNGRVRSRHFTLPVIEAQQAVARQQGCAYYNLFEAQGGEGSAGRWHRQSPRLVVADYMHLTGAGARHVGDMITDAILRGYQNR